MSQPSQGTAVVATPRNPPQLQRSSVARQMFGSNTNVNQLTRRQQQLLEERLAELSAPAGK